MINFPYPASNGQVYTTGTLTYVYNAAQQSWLTQPSSAVNFTTVNVTGSTASTSTTTGALVVTGGVGIGGALYAGSIYSNGSLLGLSSNTATNVAGGDAGSLVIQSAPGQTTFIPLGGLGSVLYSDGTTATWVASSSISSNTSTNANNIYVQQTSEDRIAGGTFYLTMASAYDDYTPIDVATSLSWDDTNNILSAPGISVTAITASTSTITGALVIAGGVGIGGDLNVNGTITASKLIVKYTTITQTLVTSPDVFTITNTTQSFDTGTGALTIAGGAGIGGNLYIGNALNVAGQTILTSTTVTNFTATSATILGNETVFGQLFVRNSTVSISTNSGALQVIGGLGVGGNINANGYIAVSNGVYSISTFTGSYNDGIIVDYTTGTGRISVGPNDALALYAGGPSNILLATFTTGTSSISSTLQSTSTTTGAFTVAGGVGIGGALFVGNTTTVSGSIIPSANGLYDLGTPTSRFRSLYVTSSTINIDGVLLSSNGPFLTAPGLLATGTFISTSTTTGAIVVTGGLGVGNNVYVGGTLNVAGQTTLTSTTVTNFTATSATILGNQTVYGQSSVQNSTVSTSTTTGAFTVAGGVGIGGALNVGGNVSVAGSAVFNGPVTFTSTATYVLTTNTFYTDNILEIHTPPGGVTSQWTFDDGKDIGLRFHYFDRTAGTDSNAALVLADDSQYLEWYNTGAESNTGTFAGAGYGTFKTGNIILAGNTQSTSTTTGALTVTGGVGIGGALNVRGTGTVSSLIVSGSSGAGDIVGVNNISATGTILASTISLSSTASSVSTTTGALTVAGGVGIGGNLSVSGTITGGGIRSTSTSTAPANPTVGDIWYDTLTDDIYRYTSDGNNSYWLDVTGAATSAVSTYFTPNGMGLIGTVTASNSANISFTGLTGYDKYMLIVEDAIPVSASVQLSLQLGTGAGPTYISSGYNSAYISGLAAAAAGQLTSQSNLQLNAFTNSQNNTASSGASGVVWLTGFLGNRDAAINGQFSQNGNSIELDIFGGAVTANTTTKTAIKISYSSGNILSGVFSLYGISS